MRRPLTPINGLETDEETRKSLKDRFKYRLTRDNIDNLLRYCLINTTAEGQAYQSDFEWLEEHWFVWDMNWTDWICLDEPVWNQSVPDDDFDSDEEEEHDDDDDDDHDEEHDNVEWGWFEPASKQQPDA